MKLKAMGVLCLSRGRLRDYRTRFGINGLTETHHVVPRCCRNHPSVLFHGFDVEGEGNFVLLPSKLGKSGLRLRDKFAETVASLHFRVRRDPDLPWNGFHDAALRLEANHLSHSSTE